MRSRYRVVLAAIAGPLLAALFWPSAAAGQTTELVAQTTLTGWREVAPDGSLGAGDPEGVGAATVRVRETEICFDINVTGVELPAAAAHIHEAPVGVNGDIVVPLTPPGADGRSSGCVTDVDPALLEALRSTPEDYYVNVHTSAYPAGAVRGQLQWAETEGSLFATSLDGQQEIGPDGQPGAGDPDGRGVSTVAVMPDAGRVCFEIWVQGIALPATAAHIHAAPAGQNGDIVVPLTAPDATGRSNGCVRGLDAGLLGAIESAPANYYVNVHTTDYPAGALRGQLAEAASLVPST